MQITGINRGDASEHDRFPASWVTRPVFTIDVRESSKKTEKKKKKGIQPRFDPPQIEALWSREHLSIEQFFLLISRRPVSRHSHKYYSFVRLDVAETITHRRNVTVSDKFAKFASRYHPIEKVPRGSSRSFGDRSPLTGSMIFRGEAKDDKAEWDEGVSMSDGGICTGLVFGDLW